VDETAKRRSDDEIVRSMIEKENDYIHYRVTWFCTLEGLLFTAFSFASGRPQIQHLLVYLHCVLGMAVAGIVLHPIWYAHRTIMNLLDWWDEHKPKDYDGPDVIGGRPMKASWRKVAAWHFLPMIFGLAWFIIFIFSLLHQLGLIA
jgi:hypothetical protein